MKTISLYLCSVSICFLTAAGAKADAEKNLASTVLTEARAAYLLGKEVEPGSANSQPDHSASKLLMSHCSYRTTGSGPNSAHVDLMIKQAQDASEAKARFDGAKLVYRGRDVPGIGEAAFRCDSPAQLHVLRGRSWITVTAGSFKADPELEQKAAAEALRNLRD